MLSDIKYSLEMSVINYCEDMCPYRACNASYDDGYELPCTVDRCFVKEYAEYLLR